MRFTRRSLLRGGVAALLLLGGLSVGVGTAHAAGGPWTDASQPPSQRADELLAAMTQAEKLTMMHGGASCGYVGCVDGNSRLGIPALHLQDGPVGAGDGFTGVTQLAAPVAGAASWDTALMQQYGQVLGSEQWGKGTNIVLAPTINIVRDPRWGRAFESFSEDPYLAGQIAAADIQGIQSQGPMAQVKHYAVYNQETNRNNPSDNAIVSARTEREIYTPAFETSINQGGADSAMCSYSAINGPFACENGPMQNGILKGDMGFQGFITSDWGATHSTVNSANNGLDMEMPGSSFYGTALTNAVNGGQVSQATLNDHVHRILQAMFKQGLFDRAQTGNTGSTVTTTAHVNTSRQAAEEGAVLLKNSGNLLPLGGGTTSIAVIGAGASNSVMYQGGGSAGVNPSGTVTPLQGIQSRAGSGVTVTYTADATTAVNNARAANVAIVVVNKGESEGSDLGNIDLASGDNTLVSNVAAANPNTIVVVNSGSAVTMPWANSVRGIVEAWYPGQQYGNALGALLWGDVNFSGKLPVTFPQSLADVPAHTAAQWPGQNNQVQYSEGLQVGYRWYDAQNKAPLFPFGFGLSYTTFSYANLTVGTPDSAGNVAVGFDVTNSGTRAGAEVAQVYVGQPASAGEPPKNLRGFQRVQLNPGQTQHVSLTLDARSFQTWTTTWTTTGGAHSIYVGSSSRDIRLTGSVTVAGSTGGGGQTVLPRTGWTATASVSSATDVPARMLDGNTATRWSTGVPMANGQTVTVDMGAVHSIDQITMDSAGSTNDYAHGYQVSLSTDGVTFGAPVATGAGTAALVTATFPAANARYIRVTQTGASSSWWSIAEFNAYTDGTTGGGGGPTLLSRTGWVASASVSSATDVPARMLDGNTATRWSTGVPMANGQTVTVDMGAAHSLVQITMDSAGSVNDYAHGYQVSLSTDGVTFGAPVATGTGTAALVTVTFPATNARYIRVTQTGASSSWWSIAEFNAYSS
jgi:beta-glucosidase